MFLKKSIAISILISFAFPQLSLQGIFAADSYTPVQIQTQNTYIKTTKRVGYLTQVLVSSLMPFSYSRLSVMIDGFQREPRGRMKDAIVYLSPYILRDSEFVKLFIHELAHYIDIYGLVPQNGSGDISDVFYGISWKSATTKWSGQATRDFVSGYAATNQYEDFAESMVFYIFHNGTFIDRALQNESIRKKYLFFARYIFPNGEFQGKDFSAGEVPSYTWDTTKLPIFLQKYLYSL